MFNPIYELEHVRGDVPADWPHGWNLFLVTRTKLGNLFPLTNGINTLQLKTVNTPVYGTVIQRTWPEDIAEKLPA